MDKTQGGTMEEIKTIIADDVEINGSIKCVGGVKLGGKVNGDLTCSGDVLIEKTAAVKGNLTVNSVVILGQVKGNITARERIELKGNARVAGDIKGKRLIVEDGVSLAGKTEIAPSESASGDMALDLPADASVAPADESGAVSDEGSRLPAGHRPAIDSRARASQLFARK